MRAITVILTGLLAIVSSPAGSQEPEWPPGGAMHTGQLHVARRDAALAVLDGLHRKLVGLLGTNAGALPPDERLISALETQQAAWKAYIVDECGLIGALTGAGGSWPSTYAVACQANLAELRVRRTRHAIRCVERTDLARRPFDANACLYQLAPVAVPLRD